MWAARQVVKHNSYYSVEVINPVDNRSYWVDIAIRNDDVEADWAQYIFYENNYEDVIRRDMQDDPDNFDEATSVAICKLEAAGFIEQCEDGSWKEVEQ